MNKIIKFPNCTAPEGSIKPYEGKSLADGGKPVRSGKWQIMNNGESYKWIVAEAAKKALGTKNIQERVLIVKLVFDKHDPSRIAGAVSFSTRGNKIYVYTFKACLLVCGGAVNIFRPRSVGSSVKNPVILDSTTVWTSTLLIIHVC